MDGTGYPFGGAGPGGQKDRNQIPNGIYNSPSVRNQLDQHLHQMSQVAAEVEQEMYIRRQMDLQRDIEFSRRLLQEQQNQFLNEMDLQQANAQQQLSHGPLTSSILQQQRFLELQRLSSPSAGAFTGMRRSEDNAVLPATNTNQKSPLHEPQQQRASLADQFPTESSSVLAAAALLNNLDYKREKPFPDQKGKRERKRKSSDNTVSPAVTKANITENNEERIETTTEAEALVSLLESTTAPKRQKDITMLLRATADPAVKDFEHYRHELAEEAIHDINGAYPKNGALDLLLQGLDDRKTEAKAQDVISPKRFKKYVPSLPLLPAEPKYASDSDENSQSDASDKRGSADPNKLDNLLAVANDAPSKVGRKKYEKTDDKMVYEPIFLSAREDEKEPVIYSLEVDTWWPSNGAVRKERRSRGQNHHEEEEGTFDKDKPGIFKNSTSAIAAACARLETDVQPGVLQKLPHCKLYRSLSKKETKASTTYPSPMFCFQVTETHCTDVMLCCSVCSTWRHAACGGHYTKYDAKDNANKFFTPICDRCHEESKIMNEYPDAQTRMARQRNEHLRRTLASMSIIRHACFVKHSGHHRWPLGNVPASQVDGHFRSVQLRHERAERQWKDMLKKIGGVGSSRSKDKMKGRTKEFERLLSFVEDAQCQMDINNMILFLRRDTAKKIPVGFESPHLNFFDPEHDDTPIGSSADVLEDRERGTGSLAENDPLIERNDDVISDKSVVSKEGEGGAVGMDVSKEGTGIDERNSSASEDDSENVHKRTNSGTCTRQDCYRKCRFDSMFCSDGCGIALVEMDLLKSFELAATLHPTAVRL